jgi:hypothetical protein
MLKMLFIRYFSFEIIVYESVDEVPSGGPGHVLPDSDCLITYILRSSMHLLERTVRVMASLHSPKLLHRFDEQ